ncbi:MAG: TraR/DksA family transcriptional regulator [Erythrobacter sp.]|nr:TraR/DksA family transcriptional regulator [Erythrobacter sp.]RZV34859.1 MAG: TraR/DksA family transcriptional regulator [Sphingomonadaceae bacterium]
MTDFAEIESQLKARLVDLLDRAEVLEDDLRHPLEADSSEQAIDLADDQALEGVDNVLREEIQQVRYALARIVNGTYGICAKCGEPIAKERLEARPIATRCIKCA